MRIVALVTDRIEAISANAIKKDLKIGALAGLIMIIVMADCTTAQATVELTDGNSTALFETDSCLGMCSWTVDGVEELNQQWFWYRVGDTGKENPLSTLKQTGITFTSRELNVQYSHPDFTVTVDFLLEGGAPSSGQANVRETVTITNIGSETLNFHFFQYVDFDADANYDASWQTTWGEVAIQLGNKGSVAATLASPIPSHYQVAICPDLLADLSDEHPTTLTDILGTFFGDLTYALQWDLLISPSGSAQISVNKVTVWESTCGQQPSPTPIVMAAGDTNGDCLSNALNKIAARNRAIPGDVNGDCVVNILDMIAVRNRIGQDTSMDDTWMFDVNKDGRINILDMIHVRNHLGESCE